MNNEETVFLQKKQKGEKLVIEIGIDASSDHFTETGDSRPVLVKSGKVILRIGSAHRNCVVESIEDSGENWEIKGRSKA